MPFDLLLLVTAVFLTTCKCTDACQIPEEYRGNWDSIESGDEILNSIKETKWELPYANTELVCKDIYIHPIEGVSQNGRNVTMLMTEKTNEEYTCYYCVDVLWRTPNILQYRKSDCMKSAPGWIIAINASCTALNHHYGLPSAVDTYTLFRTDPKAIDCSATVQGVNQFSYRRDVGDTRICDNKKNWLYACQDSGSPYVDNQVFSMSYADCWDDGYNDVQEITYQCLGTWNVTLRGEYYKYAAIADVREGDPHKKYKCMLTFANYYRLNNELRWIMSRFPDCSTLDDAYYGPEILMLKPIPRPSKFMVPKCNLPTNLTGEWTSDTQQKVTINGTHVIVQTPIDNGLNTEDVYYSCQQTSNTKYLMTKEVAGRCDVDVVCFEIESRNGSTVRYKIGKSYRDPAALNNMVEFDPTQFPNACQFDESSPETLNGILTSIE